MTIQGHYRMSQQKFEKKLSNVMDFSLETVMNTKNGMHCATLSEIN